MTSSPWRVCVLVLRATSNVTRCSPCPEEGVTLVTQFTPGVMRQVHSGKAETRNDPLPPSAARVCDDTEVVTSQATTDGLEDPTKAESQAAVNASPSTAAATANTRWPASVTRGGADEIIVFCKKHPPGATGNPGI